VRSVCALICLAACSTSAEVEYRSASSSIAIAGASVWVTSPDDDALVEVDAHTLEVQRRIDVAGAPEHVALGDGLAIVTLSLANDVAFVELATGTVSRLAVPCGGTRAVVLDAERARAFVSCPNDDRLVIVDIVERSVLSTIEAPRPTSLAIADDRVAAGGRDGVVRLFDLEGAALADTIVEAGEGRSVSQLDAIAMDESGAPIAIYQRVDNDGARDRPPEKGGYGSVVDGDPRIEPRVLGACGERYAAFDGGPRVFSGPSAIAAAAGRVWIAHRYTDNVAVLDCTSDGGGMPALVRAFRVGRGPRGIALSEDGSTAFVDSGFAHSVARLDLAAGGALVVDAPLELARETRALRFSEAGLRGRALFHDAVDIHLTPSGIVTCATCHPNGGDDGLTWFLHTVHVRPKVRRTPPGWGARPALAPYHWDAEFADLPTLTRTTIVELMEGDALLVDVDAIATYLAEVPSPPGLAASEASDRGRALFESAEVGCASCHSGADLSDGRRHAVLAPAGSAETDLDTVDTPSLRAVRARAPFLHDGRAATLRDVLTTANAGDRHGATSRLSDSDLDALVTYLETL
jgi:DNA-binding beta-propeller fold protein YncE